MEKIHMEPDEDYLNSIEDEIYEYAVEHPEEYLGAVLENYGSNNFRNKLYKLYLFGEYNESRSREREFIRRNPDGLYIHILNFMQNHLYWARLYYYDDDYICNNKSSNYNHCHDPRYTSINHVKSSDEEDEFVKSIENESGEDYIRDFSDDFEDIMERCSHFEDSEFDK